MGFTSWVEFSNAVAYHLSLTRNRDHIDVWEDGVYGEGGGGWRFGIDVENLIWKLCLFLLFCFFSSHDSSISIIHIVWEFHTMDVLTSLWWIFDCIPFFPHIESINSGLACCSSVLGCLLMDRYYSSFVCMDVYRYIGITVIIQYLLVFHSWGLMFFFVVEKGNGFLAK